MPAASKAKGAKGSRTDVVEADKARDVLRVLERGAAPPADTLAKLFRLDLGPCSASCGTKGSKGTKDNPCCFHGLLPAEGGFRKKGLWQKEPVLGQLGHDPSEDRRMSPAAPAGLRNLGNTCYVNAAMQFLHSLPAFRNALYKLEPELAEQQIVKQMRDLFIEMHFGPKRYVDPEPFANSLLLDHAIQQDGQEFLKLLLSKLEVVFAASQHQEVATVVQGLFQGHLSHVTTCHTCRRPSEGSKREVEFYELSLQVQGMPSLHTSLVAALAPDELVGDNQYFCDFCAAKSDADRRMRLRSLPPYLCLALQRFTYDHQTWEKKKVLHKLSIPLRLDMGQVLADAGLPLPDAAPLGPDRQPVLPGSPNSCYELVAVLIHKGTSASHGHYVAHIKLHDTGTWWRFDDEEAVDMGLQPTSHPGDHGTTAAAAAAAGAASGAAPPAAAAAAGGSASADAESSKPAVGKKRGRGGGAGAAAGTKRSRGAGWGGRGGRQGKRGGAKRDLWDEDSDADAEAEAATAAAEAQADEEAQMQAAMQMSLLDAQANGDMDMSAAELQAVVESTADIAAQAGVVQSSRRRGAEAALGTSSRGRGRGRGRPKGKAAAAAPVTEDKAVGAVATAEAASAEQEQAGTLPQALVDQIVSANAYFLVYRHTPDSSTQQQPAAVAAAAVPQAAGAAAAAKQEQQPQQPSDQQPLQARDPNVQPGQQPTGTKQEVMQQADAVQQQQQQQQQQQGAAGAASEQQLLLEAQHLQAQLRELPKAVQEQVAQLHQDFQQTCARFQQRKQQALAAVQHRKEEVTSIAALLPVPEGEAQGCFISTNWLDGWVNSDADPDPVDNGVLLCEEHRQLNPLLPPGAVKYISSTAWEQLTARHRGGPRLSCADVCRPCLQRLLQGIVSNEDLVEMRERVLSALETDEAQQGMRLQEPTSLYVSKTWWHVFRRRSTSTSTSRILPMLEPPTAGICCPHGRLLPEGRPTGAARRFAVSRDSWGLLKWLWAGQVVSDVQARQDKAKRTAAKRTAAGGGGDDAAAVAGATKDDDCVICDTPQKDKQQQQQQDGQQPPEVQVIDDADMDAALTDTDRQQQQQQQGADGAADRASSPGGAADAGEGAGGPAGPTKWQLPFPLDGSVPLSEEQLLQALPEFSVMAYDCETCSASLQEAAAGHEEVKQQLEGQKQALGKLLAGYVPETLEEGVLYYLVPNGWLDTWRRYLQAALARKLVTQLPPAPEPLPEVISDLMCTCHPPEQPLLAVPLPVVVNKRGRFSQAEPGGDALRVVTEQDWQQLLLHYSGLEADGVEGGRAAAASTAHQQLTAAAAGAADGPRPGRRRSGRPSEQQTQPEAGSQQEQRDMLQQRIASMADTHPGFRGIRARLRVATADVQQQQQEQQQLGSTEVQQPAAAEGRWQTQPPAQQQQQEPQANGHVTGQQQQQAVVMAGAGAGADAVDLTSSPTQQAPRRGKRQRQAAVDADVVLVESVDLVAEGLAAPAGAPDDVQVVDVDSNGVQEAAEGDGGESDRTARARSSSRSASGARAGAAAMLGRRPARRGASAGVAAAIEAAASADNLEDVGSDSEAYAVAAAAAATAAQRGWLETEPGLCEATLQAEAAARRAATLVYADAELMVELVAEEELHAAFSAAGAGERRSRRARKNRQPVKACSTDTLAMLKLRVFEVLSVHPANQRLYVRGQLLEGDNCTLAKLEVFPDEEVRVVNANQVPDDDYASVFDGVAGGKRKAREVETGFKDTALHGSSMLATTRNPAATPPPADGGADDAQARRQEQHGQGAV